MRKRRKLTVAGCMVLLAALSVWIYNSTRLAPKMVGILPEASSVVYADLAPIRAATHFDQQWDFEHDAAYDDFVKQTGIHPARDLNQIAMAIQGTPQDRRYSEILRGNFDPQPLQNWLKSHADSTEFYGGRTIFTLLHEGRPVRIAVLSSNSVAISNTNHVTNIHAMVDHRNSFFPRASALVRSHYSEVPTGSSVWWIADSTTELSGITVGSNYLDLGLPRDSVLVGSLRYAGALEIRVAAITNSEQQAATLLDRLQSALTMAHAIIRQENQQSDPVTEVVNSISLREGGQKVVLTADIPNALLTQLAHAPDSKRAQH